MKCMFITAVSLALCTVACSSTPKEKDLPKTPRRVLFIGSGLTSANGGVANALNHLSHGLLNCAAATSEDQSLAWRWTHGSAVEKLRSERWDDVVLQDTPQQIVSKPDMFSLFVRRFDAEINRTGARSILYVPFPRADRLQSSAAIDHACEDITATLHQIAAPVGEAFENAAKERPDLKLYAENNSDPSPAGTYLAACVFYATLLERTPVGLESFVVDGSGNPVITLAPDDAKFLQKVAQQTVVTERAPSDPEIEDLLKQ